MVQRYKGQELFRTDTQRYDISRIPSRERKAERSRGQGWVLIKIPATCNR